MTIIKRSVNIQGHATSITLEEEFWHVLKAISKKTKRPIRQIVAELDEKKAPEDNLSSAIRVFVLKSAQDSGALD